MAIPAIIIIIIIIIVVVVVVVVVVVISNLRLFYFVPDLLYMCGVQRRTASAFANVFMSDKGRWPDHDLSKCHVLMSV